MTEEQKKYQRNYKKKYYKNPEICKKATNKYRENVNSESPVLSYTDSTLMSFKKIKLIALIRKLEKENAGR